ncbi:hypothetical protein D3C87_1445730 [compost metagenome]
MAALRRLFHRAGKLVAHDARIGKIRLITGENMQVRAADTNATNTHQHFTFATGRLW